MAGAWETGSQAEAFYYLTRQANLHRILHTQNKSKANLVLELIVVLGKFY